VRGLVCLGYPFHPPGAPEKLRTKHLETLKTPALILQGERDPFGPRDEVARYKLSKSIRIEWLADGDHSFKPRKSSGFSEADHLAKAAEMIAAFIVAE
jgi:predicted alpha/beta-hydrolase family hydrolase